VRAVRTVGLIDKLFQIQGADELNARLANTILSVGWDSTVGNRMIVVDVTIDV